MQLYAGVYGSTANEGDEYVSKWDMVIDTTYKMFAANQCESTGLVTNWANVTESLDGTTLSATTGFSGSGTPGAEFGAEASRAVWRVALDYLLFPEEAHGAASSFLGPIARHVAEKENAGQFADLDIDSSCLVASVHADWQWNAFMFGPVFSSLVVPAEGVLADQQQAALASAGYRIKFTPIDDYYSGSWLAISTITVNGDFSKAASLLHTSPPAPTGTPTSAPTPATPPPTLSCSAAWTQCGGINWTGPTCCSGNRVCTRQNEWYSQCD
jgi:hypothetical protein